MNDLKKSDASIARDLVDGRIIRASDFAGEDVPPRQWHVPELIPARTVTMLSGDGGLGKSTLALQLAAATCLGKPWLGRTPRSGDVLYLSAEDDADELHRRLHEIALHYDVGLEDLSGLHLLPLADQEATLAIEGQGGVLTPTTLWAAISRHVARQVGKARLNLVVLDSLADVFAGNEVNRAHARQFIAQLRRLAIDCSVSVLILAHPSLSGMSSGSGMSGSTHWNNSVRSRLYMARPDSEDGIPDPDARVLRLMKANYTGAIPDMRLRRKIGGYVLEGGSSGYSPDVAAGQARADRVFLDMLAAYTAEERHVSHKTGHNYAPAVFARDARSKGIGKPALLAAMNRLFAEKRIAVESFGPQSRRLHRLVISEGGE